MNPFDRDYKPQIPTPSPRERKAAKDSRRRSAELQEVLDRRGPQATPTAAQREVDRLKTTLILKGGM